MLNTGFHGSILIKLHSKSNTIAYKIYFFSPLLSGYHELELWVKRVGKVVCALWEEGMAYSLSPVNDSETSHELIYAEGR